MATDEEAPNPSPLPSYSEMILAAIEALDEKQGSNKSSISNYIESKYADKIPEAHASLLTAHLARMKESGEVVMVKNNYMKAGPDAPPKRGRGRPPKPKGEGAPAAPAPAAEAGPARPRGRPPKKPRVDGEDVAERAVAPAETASPAQQGVKRGRGRPPKVKTPAFVDVGFA